MKIPQGIDPHAVASLSDNMTDAYRTVAPYLKAEPGANILIVGGVAEKHCLLRNTRSAGTRRG
jgi:D-arabinose 1-dehydrogenase-like Zn-dependent alcohol dehydrogenase